MESAAEIDNKDNLQFFVASSMSGLYDRLQAWQFTNKKRFLSLSIHKQGEDFACIALTNPTEVVIVCRDGRKGDYREVGRYDDKLLVKTF